MNRTMGWILVSVVLAAWLFSLVTGQTYGGAAHLLLGVAAALTWMQFRSRPPQNPFQVWQTKVPPKKKPRARGAYLG